MRAVDIIMKKRGFRETGAGTLSREEIAFLVNGYVAGEIPDYQMAAWLMAVYFNGMTFDETAVLTDVMLHSGAVMDLSGIGGPFVDKHSTGGVGDKLSLPLAPIVAAVRLATPAVRSINLNRLPDIRPAFPLSSSEITLKKPALQ